ncbi:MAG: hemin uptake protein HemP [Magnetospirillum sp.]|nr:hemin uptake protein HemP [Magnetospirillum sp.]
MSSPIATSQRTCLVIGPDGRRRVPLDKLLGKNNELVIVHQGQEYLLRLTSNGKLLLTK